MEQFMKINTAVNGFVWGPVMLALLVGTGIYLSIAVGFIQFTKIGYWWKNTIGKIFKKGEAGDGEITPLQAVSTALASTVGTGNIAGVTGAIILGGPGAVFWMWLIALLGGGAAFYLLWELDKIPDYMKERFMVVFDHNLDPLGAGWQQTRSLLALGGGKLTGQGLFHGIQTQGEYSGSLPFRYTDFIFSAIGEELGMLGCLAVLLLLAAIIVRCLMVARKARNTTESYVCVGVAAVLIFQTISNVGMCLFVLPVIGLTLPFFSYGGSSIVTLFAAIGMVSSVQSHSLPDWLR